MHSRHILLPMSFIFIFFTSIFTVYFIVNSPYYKTSESALTYAFIIDLTILIPIIYYNIIKFTNIPKTTTVGVFIVSFTILKFLIPENRQSLLNNIEYLLPFAEIFFILFILNKVRTMFKKAHPETGECFHDDMVDSIRCILGTQLKSRVLANILTTELSVFYFAIFGWRRFKHINSTSMRFSYHKESGYGVIIWTFIFLILFETAVVHLALASYTIILAWILTGLSIYSIFFLLGDFNAARNRPIRIDNEFLYLNIGIRWTAKIPRSEILNINLSTQSIKGKSIINMVLFGDPNMHIQLKSVNSALGVYGIKKEFDVINLYIDKKDQFIKSLNSST